MSTTVTPQADVRPARPRRRRRRSVSRVLVWLLAAAATAVAVVMADAAPTGLTVLDAVFRGAMAGLVTLAGSRARRWSWLAGSGLVCLAANFPWLAVGLAALGVSLLAAVLDVRRRDLSAAVGGAVAVTALHLQIDRPVGASAALAAVAVGVIAFSGVRTMRRRQRRRIYAVAGAAGALVVAAAVMFLFAVLSARDDAERGIDLARSGLTAAREGDQEQAVRDFEEAETAFRQAVEATGGLLAQPARLVPLLSQNARALEELAIAGGDLASTGASTAAQADVQSLQLRGGALDLARVAAMEQPLAEATAALAATAEVLEDVESPWLVPPLGNAVEDLDERVSDALPDAQIAVDAVRLAPAILGGDGPRTYFVAFVTPSEQRGSGGILGNFAQLDVVDGRLNLSRTGRSRDLNDASDEFLRTITDMPEFSERYAGWAPARFWQNVTVSPDFPTTARVIEQLYFQSGGVPVDGVISVDPTALAALLRLTGPVDVPGLPEPLTHRNAEDILLRDQYVTFPERPERVDFLDEASRLTFQALTTRDLPEPKAIADALAPVVAQDRLRAHSVHPEEQDLFERMGLAGGLGEVRGDWLGVVTENGSANKIDIFLHRTVSYDVTVDPGSNEVTATLDVTLENQAPASGLPDYVIGNPEDLDLAPGHTRVWLSVFTALFVEEATLDGQPLALAPSTELGRQVYSEFLVLAPGQRAEVSVQLRGPLDLAERYLLDLHHQPIANPDEVTVTVRGADGAEVDPVQGLEADGDGATAAFTLTEDRTFVAELTRP